LKRNARRTAMNGYMISTRDAPGLAARLLEATAARGVNVFPAYGLADGQTGIILVGSDDEDGLRGAIADAGLQATAVEMVTTEIDNRPGRVRSSSASWPTPVSTCERRCRSAWARTRCSWPSRRTTPPRCAPPSTGRRSGLRLLESVKT
jgi:hypothetical protein